MGNILSGCSKGFVLGLNLMKELNQYVYIGHDEAERMTFAGEKLKAILKKMAESDSFVEKVDYVYHSMQERFSDIGFFRFLKIQEVVYRTTDGVELIEHMYDFAKRSSRS